MPWYRSQRETIPKSELVALLSIRQRKRGPATNRPPPFSLSPLTVTVAVGLLHHFISGVLFRGNEEIPASFARGAFNLKLISQGKTNT